MTIIRQQSLFGIRELYDMEPTQQYQEIMSALDLDAIFFAINKKSSLGAPVELNYGAMIVSFFIRYVERIPTIAELVKLLKRDLSFKLDCGFKVSNPIPSETSCSRLLMKLSESDVLELVQQKVIKTAICEGFIADETIAIDATHFEARDQAPPKEAEVRKAPKKRGRKWKEEREQWLADKSKEEANLSLYEKKIEAQLEAALQELRIEIPQAPKWGIKKNSEGKNVFWFGYKGHLAVGATSQYILQSVLSSGNLNDGKAAIPLLKGVAQYQLSTIQHHSMDAG